MSDTHVLHWDTAVPNGDILIHAGDSLTAGQLDELDDVNEWLGSLPHPHKVLIAGNHDHAFEQFPEKARCIITNAHYLQDEEVVVAGVRIYGSPWTPRFCDLAFNADRGPRSARSGTVSLLALMYLLRTARHLIMVIALLMGFGQAAVIWWMRLSAYNRACTSVGISMKRQGFQA